MNLSPPAARLRGPGRRESTSRGRSSAVTSPPSSALIRQLEDSAGLRLFDRDTRNVELTAEGRVLEASARRLLADMELAMDDLRDHAAGAGAR